MSISPSVGSEKKEANKTENSAGNHRNGWVREGQQSQEPHWCDVLQG